MNDVEARVWIPILRRRGVPPLFYSLINHGYRSDYYLELLGLSHGCEYHRYVDGWVVIEAEDSARFRTELEARLEEPDYVRYFVRRCQEVADAVLATGHAIRQRPTADRVDLLADFMRFASASIRVMPFLNTMVFVQEAVERRLRSLLAGHSGLPEDADELDGVMQAAMVSDQKPLATEALVELKRIAAETAAQHPGLAARIRAEPRAIDAEEVASEAPAIGTALAEFLDRFDFLETDYYLGEPTTADRLLDQLAVFLRRRWEGGPNDPVAAPASELPHDQATAAFLDVAQSLQYLREYRLEALFKAGRDCRELFEAIGEAIGLSYLEVVHLTFDEVQRSLSSGTPVVELAEVAARIEGYASSVEAGRATIATGDAITDLRAGLPAPSTRASVLSGVTAFPGEVTGTVRIVDRLDAVGSLAAGEILVAPMTLPYHVPAMARAAAVLTDEGGILSHAAIVCRELRVPCVVGLGTATSVLTDGELVRVVAHQSGGKVERASSD